MDSERARMLAAIARAFVPLPEVRAAMLFGSRATGRARSDSDIDIAVLLEGHRWIARSIGQLKTVLGPLTTELAADRIDLVFLNDAPPALAFQVLKYGVVAFERDPVDLHRFRARTYSAHADYAHVERFFREVTKRRITGARDSEDPNVLRRRLDTRIISQRGTCTSPWSRCSTSPIT